MVPEKMLELKAQGLLAAAATADAKAARLLARAFYTELREGGFTPEQVIAASNELLEMITADVKARVGSRSEEAFPARRSRSLL